ncbi:PLD nuclease N-terminal domain-containing protein [Parachryseolinea silvisoli]|uniref:PLD nuclease N-terminal domain-containing protein n=1 Tax=Parachryseolinea silvisoli TaxID=2873601 RepID=UPI0037CBEF6F|nr:PLD nuclease N-terminal domain-containing protein [Parachryseolinea silvisoli]
MIAYIGNNYFAYTLALAWVAFFILTIIDIFSGSFREQSNRILWLLFVLFIPGLGVLLYWAWGRTTKVPR